MSDDLDVLGALPDGIVRTARKIHRCVCADRLLPWGYSVRGEYDGGWSELSCRTLLDAERAADRMRNSPAKRSGEHYALVIIIERENPDYRPDCLGDINPGDRYYEYLGDSMAFQSGHRYCSRCAVAVWGGH